MNARVSLLYLMYRLVFHEAFCLAFAVEKFTYNHLYRETSHFRITMQKIGRHTWRGRMGVRVRAICGHCHEERELKEGI
jgi:hypothetical protein